VLPHTHTPDAPTTHSNSLRGKPAPVTCVLKKTFVPPCSFQKQPLGRFSKFVGAALQSLPMAAAALAHASALVIFSECAGHSLLPESPTS
jgi:hypothetical protein